MVDITLHLHEIPVHVALLGILLSDAGEASKHLEMLVASVDLAATNVLHGRYWVLAKSEHPEV